MSEAIKFFDGIIEERVSNIHTCMPCRVEKFNGDSADVQPIPRRKLKNGQEMAYSLLVNVPILKRKTKTGTDPVIDSPYYEKGDIVLVVFAESALDGVGNRKHDLSDGIIIGLLR